jgi:hypothetical protein
MLPAIANMASGALLIRFGADDEAKSPEAGHVQMMISREHGIGKAARRHPRP